MIADTPKLGDILLEEGKATLPFHVFLEEISSNLADPFFYLPAGHTLIISSATPLTIPSNSIVQVDGIIKQEQTGDAGIFLIDAGTTNVKIFGSGSLQGPYTETTPAPTGNYPGGNGAIRINGDYDSVAENICIEGIEITGWGDYGIFAENATGNVHNCHLHKIGRDGVRTYGAEYFSITDNHIHNISPGLTGNAYGVTFTRRPDNVATPLTVNPPSRRCIASNNVVWDVTVWKGLDTHGGIDIVFSGNVIESCKIGIGIDEGDTTTLDDAPPKNVTITNNIIRLGDASAVESGINVASSDASNPAEGIVINQNTIIGCGGTNRAAINLNYLNGALITNNFLLDSVVAGIRLKTECVDTYIAGNVIKDMTGTLVGAIASEDADTIATVDSGVFHQTTGSYTAFSLGTPTDGTKGVKVNFEGLDYIGTITRFTSGHEDRTRADFETATGTVTLDSTIATTIIDSSGGAVTATLNEGPKYGFIKTIIMEDATNSSTVSVTNHAVSDPEVFTFDAVDKTAVLMWTGTEWVTLYFI